MTQFRMQIALGFASCNYLHSKLSLMLFIPNCTPTYAITYTKYSHYEHSILFAILIATLLATIIITMNNINAHSQYIMFCLC